MYQDAYSKDPVLAAVCEHDMQHKLGGPGGPKKHPLSNHPFGPMIRLRLMKLLLEAPVKEKGCGFDFQQLAFEKDDYGLEQFFPLHTANHRHELEKAWIPTMGWGSPFGVPVHSIRRCVFASLACCCCCCCCCDCAASRRLSPPRYFGEKIALYFCFLAHYTEYVKIRRCCCCY